jgi:hypothetical protein
VEDIKKMMISYDSQATHLGFYNKKSVLSGQYLFNFMEFAYKESWIGQEQIKRYFHDSVLENHALGFAFQFSENLSREHGANVYIWDVLESVVKHWNWPLTHELFKGNNILIMVYFSSPETEIYYQISSCDTRSFG